MEKEKFMRLEIDLERCIWHKRDGKGLDVTSELIRLIICWRKGNKG